MPWIYTSSTISIPTMQPFMVAEPWLIPNLKLLDNCICAAELLAFITRNDLALWKSPFNSSLDLTRTVGLTPATTVSYIFDSAYDAARRGNAIGLAQSIKRKNRKKKKKLAYEKQPSWSTPTRSPVRSQPSTNASRVAFSSFQ